MGVGGSGSEMSTVFIMGPGPMGPWAHAATGPWDPAPLHGPTNTKKVTDYKKKYFAIISSL